MERRAVPNRFPTNETLPPRHKAENKWHAYMPKIAKSPLFEQANTNA